MSTLRLKQKITEATPGYSHSDSVRKYLLRHNLFPAEFLHELSPDGANRIIRRHKSRKRVRAGSKLILWMILLAGIGVSWIKFDLSQTFSDFSSQSLRDSLSNPKELFRIKSKEEKELEARMNALLIQPIGLEEDFHLQGSE